MDDNKKTKSLHIAELEELPQKDTELEKSGSFGLKSRALILFSIIAFFLLIYFSIVEHINFRDSEIFNNQQQMLQLSKSISLNIQQYTIESMLDIKTIAQNKIIQNGISKKEITPNIEKILNNVYNNHKKDVDAIYLLDPNGICLHRIPFWEDNINRCGTDFSSKPHISYVLEKHEPFVSELYINQAGYKVISFVVPVFKNDEFVGIAYLMVSIENISKRFIQSMIVGKKGYAQLFDDDGTVYSHPESEQIGKNVITYRKEKYPNYDWTEYEDILTKMYRGEEGVGTYHSLWWSENNDDMSEKLIAYYPLTVSNEKWSVSTVMDYTEISEPINKHAKFTIIVMGFISFLFGLGGLILYSVKKEKAILQERAKKNVALIESEKRYKQITNAITDYFFTVYIKNGQPVQTIHGLASVVVTGYTPDEFKADPDLWIKIVHEEDRATVIEQSSQILSGKDTIQLEHRIMQKNGTIKWVVNTLVPYYDSKSNLISYDGLIHDITERKKAEEALLANEKDLKESQRIAHLGSWRLETATNEVVWSEELYKMYGFDPALPPPSYTEHQKLFTPESWERLSISLSNTRKTGTPYELELETIREDGSNGWMWVRGEAVLDENSVNVGLWGAAQDITERKRTEKELRESAEFIKAVMDHLPIGVAVNSVDPTVDFNYMNDNFPKYYRTTREMLADPNAFWNTVYEDSEFREVIKKKILDDCASGDPERMFWDDVPITRKEEETSFISARNIPVPGKNMMISTVWDVTDRKKSEEELKESEKRFKEAVINSPHPIMIHSEDGEILQINKIWTDLTGYTQEEIPTIEDWTKRAYGKSLGVVKKTIDDLFYENKKQEHGEYSIRIKSGETIKWDFSSAPLGTLSDGRRLVMSIAKDVTERKQLEDQLFQSQKMESIGLLAGGVAHDFNNIIQAISLNTELSLLSLPPESPLEDSLKEIKTNSDRAADLTRQLLAFSRRQVIDPKIVSLNDIIKGMKKMLGRLIGENIEVITDLSGYIWMVNVDKGQIEQVVTNLAVNARDSMPNGGKLTIETANITLDKEFTQTNEIIVPGEYVSLTVSDTGTGMDEKTQSQVFEPFFTTKGVGKGTGLGLSTCYGIVRQNNGYIWANSELGVGTAFKIYLPIVKDETATDIVRESTFEELPTGTETILLVEDDDSILKVNSKILSRKGYTVLTAKNGMEALPIVKEHGEKIQLVITDVVMPQMGGKELADKIHETYPDIKVLFMSGYTDDSIAHQGVLNDDVAFLAKPSSSSDLLNKVRQLLDE